MGGAILAPRAAFVRSATEGAFVPSRASHLGVHRYHPSPCHAPVARSSRSSRSDRPPGRDRRHARRGRRADVRGRRARRRDEAGIGRARGPDRSAVRLAAFEPIAAPGAERTLVRREGRTRRPARRRPVHRVRRPLDGERHPRGTLAADPPGRGGAEDRCGRRRGPRSGRGTHGGGLGAGRPRAPGRATGAPPASTAREPAREGRGGQPVRRRRSADAAADGARPLRAVGDRAGRRPGTVARAPSRVREQGRAGAVGDGSARAHPAPRRRGRRRPRPVLGSNEPRARRSRRVRPGVARLGLLPSAGLQGTRRADRGRRVRQRRPGASPTSIRSRPAGARPTRPFPDASFARATRPR